MHSTKSRVVIGPSNILLAGVYVCTFQPENFTGYRGGSEGVKHDRLCGVIASDRFVWQRSLAYRDRTVTSSYGILSETVNATPINTPFDSGIFLAFHSRAGSRHVENVERICSLLASEFIVTLMCTNSLFFVSCQVKVNQVRVNSIFNVVFRL